MRFALCGWLVLALLTPSTAQADDTEVGPDSGGFYLEGDREVDPEGGGGADNVGLDPPGEYNESPVCQVESCPPQFICPDGSPMLFRWFVNEDGTTEQGGWVCPDGGSGPTVGMIANAFRHIPLPASPLIIQPPDGRTLVNFETNFYTEKEQLFRSVTLLGQRIELRIDVHSYTWHFDDGERLRTSDPGAPYPKLQITHNYLQAGAYRPRLDTTYVANYRVNGGAWQTVPGSVTIEGSPESLRAVEARPILTG